MQAAASAAADQAAIVGKRELAAALNWSRPTLDRRLLQDPTFPVRRRGSQAGGWEFELAAVHAYLNGVRAPEPADDQPAEPDAEPSTPAGPGGEGRAAHQGEATARQRRDQADAALKEDRLRRQRAELVDVEMMRQSVSTMLAGVATKLNNVPDAIVRRLGLPETAGPVIRDEIDRIRKTMVEDLRAVLIDD